MAFIGLDDTDHLGGRGTSRENKGLLTHLESEGHKLVAPPRLVRLWPFAPNRTRGNGALAAEINPCGDFDALVGSVNRWFDSSFPIYEESQLKEWNISPALVLADRELSAHLYWEAVRGNVNLEARREELKQIEGLHIWSRCEGRGLIGASSAVAWPQSGDHTWEATAWRCSENIGTRRCVDVSVVNEMCLKFKNTVLNRDPNCTRTLIAPATPCPVLYGIRAETEKEAKQAHLWLQSQAGVEQSNSYRVHKTNQATGDHLVCLHTALVVGQPLEVRGGHAHLPVSNGQELFNLVAFKEGGEVNYLLRQLEVGDVVVWGGLHSGEGDVHLELLKLSEAVPRKLRRPHCRCGTRYRRQGRGQPLRCDSCKSTTDCEWLASTTSDAGYFVEPPLSQRRHLARPLNRPAKG